MIGLLATPLSSTAAEREVTIAPLAVDGALPRDSVRQLHNRLNDAMSEAGFEVLGKDGTGASVVLRVSVRVKQRDYVLIAELLEADGVTTVVRVEDHCDLCGLEEVGEHLGGLVASIRDKLDADARARPQLNVTTTPAGATVRVNGNVVGVSPIELSLSPGMHVVRVEKAGFSERERHVELVRGVDESVAVTLSPLPGEDASARPRRPGPAPWVGWTILGGGAALGVAGIALLAIHGRPVRSKCSGGNVDMDGTCRFNHHTVVPGAILGATGIALLATGIALVVTRKHRAKRSPDFALTAAPGGLEVRF